MIATAPEPGPSVSRTIDRSIVGRNAAALVAAQAAALLIPLVTLPYLARTLGPSQWGPLLAAQGIANWLVVMLEYGFDLTGTRAVARVRENPSHLQQAVHQVQSAKIWLALGVGPAAVLLLLAIPALRAEPELILWGVAAAILRGLTPLWYFQGVERMRGAVAIDAGCRSLAALGVFAVVTLPEHAPRVLALQALFSGVSLAALTKMRQREVPIDRPTWRAARTALRQNWSTFAYRASGGIYLQANTFVLATMAAPASVAFFGGAERIIRAAINLLNPLTQALVPRMSYLQANSRSAAERAVGRLLVSVGGLGLAMGIVAYVGSPFLVGWLLGPGYQDAIPVLKLLAILPGLVAVNTVLGLFWAFPFGHERGLFQAVLVAGAVNLVSAVALVPRLGVSGMALASIAAELVVLLMLVTLFVRNRRS